MLSVWFLGKLSLYYKVVANLPHKVPLEEIYLFPETNFHHGLRIKLIFLHFKKKGVRPLLALTPSIVVQGFRSGIAGGHLKWRRSLEHLSPATAGLCISCVLGLSPAGSASSVHGRRCYKEIHPNIENLKQSLQKTDADFPVDVL